MKIVVLAVGRPREKRLASLADEYLARIRPAGLVGVERVPDAAARPAEAVEREGQELLKRIRPRDCVVLLREDGTERSSRELASFLSERILSVQTGLITDPSIQDLTTQIGRASCRERV